MKQPRKRHASATERVTIQAVAAQAGVSPMTVSNVFNRKGKVGEATRQRVLTIIREMGYVPSQAARRLVGAAPARIGLIFYDANSMFINAALATISVATAERGLQLLMREAKSFEPAIIFDTARALVRSGADALLLLPPFAELLSAWPGFAEMGVPAAAIATARPLPGMSTARIDNRAAARAITGLLIAQGRRRIAMVTGPGRHSDGMARLDGHRAALADYGIAFDPALCVEGDFTFPAGIAAAEQLLALSPRPDAIVAANDDMAAGVLLVAHRLGLHLPRDLAVTGFDDTLIATRVWPALTTVSQPLTAMVSAALDAVLASLNDADAPCTDQVLDFAVIERESAAPA